MDAYRLQVKLYLAPDSSPQPASLIPIFHRWIQRDALDETLIDVADYSSVPNGPGVMLIAHHAHYSLDATDGRPGLVYARKRPEAGSFGERLRMSWQRALTAARALEKEPDIADNFHLPGDRIAIRIHDRLLAPNTAETFDTVEPDVYSLLAEIYGETPFTLRREEDPGECFGIQVEVQRSAPYSTAIDRAMTSRCISLVPSPSSSTLQSR